MRLRFIPPYLAVVIAFGLSGCKKAEQPPAASNSEAPKPVESAKHEPAKAAEAAPTGEEIVLHAKWPVGNRYVYRMDLDQHSTNQIPQMPRPMQQDVTMAMTYAVSSLSELPGGGHEVEMEFLADEMEIKMGEQVVLSFDSKEAAKPEPQNPFAAPFRKMVGSKIRMQMDANGKVDKVLDHQKWLESLMADSGPAGGMLGQQFNEGFIRQLAGFGTGLPDKPVKVGEGWPFQMDLPAGPLGKISIDSQVKLMAIEEHEQHKCARLHFTGSLKSTPGQEAGPMGKMSIEGGNVDGTTWLDPELGAMVESSQVQTMKLEGQMPGGPPGAGQAAAKFTINLGQKITTKLVEVGKTDK